MSKRNPSCQMCAVAIALVLSACSPSPQKPQAMPRPTQDASKCIRVAELAEWEPLSDRSLLLSTPGNPRAHLLTLATPIEDLQLADDIEIIDGDLDEMICPGRDDVIFVAQCQCASSSIVSIDYLSEQRTAELQGNPSTIL